MALDYKLYLHDSDKAAMAALKAIPGFSQVMKAFMKIWSEQQLRLINMSTNLRLNEKQMANGVLVFDANVPPFIATMASMTIVRNIILLITGAKTISGLPKGFTAIAAGSVFGVPNLFLAWFAIILMSFFISKKTVFGRNIYSYGSNKEAARLSGINTRVTVYGVYVFCAVVCGIAGILLTSRLGNGVPTSGDGYELDAIAAAVVGGASLDGGEGSVIGTVLGAMIMAMLRQGGTLLGINSFIMEIIIGSLIALAVVIDKIRRR